MEKTISTTVQQLCELAETNKEGNDITSAIGEVEIAGYTYQLQLSLVANNKLWCKENAIRFSEVVKIH